MKQTTRTSSRKLQDFFYKTNSKTSELNWSRIAIATVIVLVLFYFAYQFGNVVGEAAFKQGL